MKTKFLSIFALGSLFTCSGLLASPLDSIGLEKKNGQTLLLHKVEPHETLYAIARKYRVSPGEVVELNPAASKSMKVGDIVRVPHINSNLGGAKTVTNTKTVASNNTQSNGEGSITIHEVKAGDNLNRIAKKYGVTIKQVADWNNLSNTSTVKLGQKLKIIGVDDEVTPEVTTIASERPVHQDSIATAPKEDEMRFLANASPKLDTLHIKSVETAEGAIIKMLKVGVCEITNAQDIQDKYVAFSNEIPEGTMIKAKNLDNNEYVFLKIAGLKKGHDPKVLLEIGLKTKERLESTAKEFPIEVNYVK
jgi:LysM repeat protein